MELTFNIVSKIDLIAVYAAVVASAVLIWDVIKWMGSKARLNGRLSTGMKMFGFTVPGYSADQFYTSISVTNVGNQPTTITHVLLYAYGCWFNRFVLRKRSTSAFVAHDSRLGQIPYLLEPGKMFSTYVAENDEYISLSQNERLYVVISHSMGRDHYMRVPPISSSNQEASQ